MIASSRRTEDGERQFERFRDYLLKRYSGVEVAHSFADDAGQIVDCIPIEQQPSRRLRPGEPLATPPAPLSEAKEATYAPDGVRLAPSMLPPPLTAGASDRYGNARVCPPGTVPILRTTLESFAEYKDLTHFFRKAPDGGRLPGDGKVSADARAVEATHRYAHAFQPVANLGGASILNLWLVPIGMDQIFSLTQQWYVAGQGANRQTVECGLQIYPGKYNSPQPVLFIYYTSADYANGSGCYNLDCDAFTQTSSTTVIGAAFSPTSISGGQQYEIKLSYQFDGTMWWLLYQDQPIGYYSGSLFNGGALTRGAEIIDFGGETVGATSFPPMGSGAFPESGFGFAAYQRNVQYFPAGGGVADATLIPQQDTPACYRISLLNNSGTEWGTHFFFGGVGGVGC